MSLSPIEQDLAYRQIFSRNNFDAFEFVVRTRKEKPFSVLTYTLAFSRWVVWPSNNCL